MPAGAGFMDDGFGGSIAASGDTVVVGAPTADDLTTDGGSAHVFFWNGSNWVDQGRLISPSQEANELFGKAVAVSGDRLAIGAPGNDDATAGVNAGMVYVSTRTAGVWSAPVALSVAAADLAAGDALGSALSMYGDRLIIGIPLDDTTKGADVGSVLVYQLSGSTWVKQAKLEASDGAAGDRFGMAVSIRPPFAIVGAPYKTTKGFTRHGQVYAFGFSTTWSERARLLPPALQTNGVFGSAVSVGDKYVLAGEPTLGSGAGAAHLYRVSSWTFLESITATDGVAGDRFGASVAVEVDTALVGAPQAAGLTTHSGAVYPLVEKTGHWSQSKAFANDGADGDEFGGATAISGTRGFIGSPSDDNRFANAGAAYAFGLLRTTGERCATVSECQAGLSCVDGFCWDTACNNICVACSAALKQSGTGDGVCGPTKTGIDPHDQCATTPTTGCKEDGYCNGQGGCRLWVKGTGCGATVCQGNSATGQVCDGLGTCTTDTTGTLCDPFVCKSGSCPSTCVSDTDCNSTHYCADDSICQLKKQLGDPCSLPHECASTNCVDGVCCNTTCSDDCHACAANLKASQSDNGSCGPALSGSDPHSDCPDNGPSNCSYNGVCDGTGACAVYGPDTSCGPVVCNGNVSSGQFCTGGACTPSVTGTDCYPYVCTAGVCPSVCSKDADCMAGNYCDAAHHCSPKLNAGTTCTSSNACKTGFCVDDVCCDTACTDLCLACAATYKENGQDDGVCGAAKESTDPHDDCIDEGAATCGKDGFCNGSGGCRKYGGSTSCGATVCDGNLAKGQLCDGTGTCVTNTTGQDCAPYVCTGGLCPTSCVVDTQCVATAYCTASGVCEPKLPAGSACQGANQCATGFCADGVCCNQACSSLCMACSATKKGSGNDGDCGPIQNGADPDHECTDGGSSTCKLDGACNGAGACRLYAAGTSCGTTQCVGNNVAGLVCDGQGACITSSGTPCSPYQCQGGSCASPCTADSHCVQGNFCSPLGECKTVQPSGSPCTVASQCSSGFCVDGACCQTQCGGSCMACSAALKESGADGECGPTKAGTDPDDNCDKDPVSTCGKDGMCDGSGACSLYGTDTTCGSAVCVSGTLKNKVCTGLGECSPEANGTDCAPYTCDASACTNPCLDEADCTSGNTCKGGACVPKGDNGASCTTAAECNSAFCADGVCCDTECTGQCEACDVSGKVGTCSAVTGAPHGSRAPCGGAGICAGTCDGQAADECAFPGSAVACNKGCAADQETSGTCDGAGTCAEDAPKSCAPYRCDTDACMTSCGAPGDCAPGYACEAGACVAGADAGTEAGTGGSAGSAGTGSSAPDQAPSDSGGCGCATPGRAPGNAALTIFALAALGVARRRRRTSRVV